MDNKAISLELADSGLVTFGWEKQITTNQLFQAALSLPDEAKATLAEQLVAHLVSQIEPGVNH